MRAGADAHLEEGNHPHVLLAVAFVVDLSDRLELLTLVNPLVRLDFAEETQCFGTSKQCLFDHGLELLWTVHKQLADQVLVELGRGQFTFFACLVLFVVLCQPAHVVFHQDPGQEKGEIPVRWEHEERFFAVLSPVSSVESRELGSEKLEKACEVFSTLDKAQIFGFEHTRDLQVYTGV